MLLLPAVASGMPQLDCVYACDALTMLKAMPCNSVDCVVTSPPYYGLRDYGVAGQIGLEQTPREFVDKLVRVFREVRRVLKPSGTCWLNLGDTYSAGGRGHDTPKQQSNKGTGIGAVRDRWDVEGFSSKQLLMIPARVAIALQEDGWWLRSEIIWSKPNPMPESVKDRPTKAHEMVYLLTKAPSYWYDATAIMEPAHYDGRKAMMHPGSPKYANGFVPNTSAQTMAVKGHERWQSNEDGDFVRNARSVWTINTEPTPFAHFATFPTKLVERCIRAGCPAQICVECGKPYESQIEASGGTIGKGWTDHKRDLEAGMSQVKHSGGVGSAISENGQLYRRKFLGNQPACTCNADTRPGVVLDPFGGSGTVGLVAREWGRRFLLCDLNPEYVKLAQSRLAVPFTLPMFA